MSISIFGLGHVHVQVSGASGAPYASLSNFALPLHQWCRLVISIDNHQVLTSHDEVEYICSKTYLG